jgi:hypothetical protein
LEDLRKAYGEFGYLNFTTAKGRRNLALVDACRDFPALRDECHERASCLNLLVQLVCFGQSFFHEERSFVVHARILSSIDWWREMSRE